MSEFQLTMPAERGPYEWSVDSGATWRGCSEAEFLRLVERGPFPDELRDRVNAGEIVRIPRLFSARSGKVFVRRRLTAAEKADASAQMALFRGSS